MRKIQIAFLVVVVLGLANVAHAQGEHIFLIKAFNCPAGPKGRTQTGFRIRGRKGVVTTLHGIAGCATVKAQSKQGPILSSSLVLAEVDIENDLAFLTSDELLVSSDDGLSIASDTSLIPQQNVSVTGHPYGIAALTTQLILRDPPVRPLRDLLTEEVLSALLVRRSPAPNISVLSVQGAIVPGNSGAPIINSNGDVIGVANGGLNGGATDITWAIPLQRVHWKAVSSVLSENIRQLGNTNPNSLFSFDENIPPKFPLTLEDRKDFSKGQMTTKIVVASDGKLTANTTTRGTNTFDGFCGNVTFWFFDRTGNNLGVYGMGPNHQWCVGSGVESAIGGGPRLRTDRQEIPIPADTINRTNSVAIIHLEGPGKRTAELLQQFLNRALEVKKQVEQ